MWELRRVEIHFGELTGGGGGLHGLQEDRA